MCPGVLKVDRIQPKTGPGPTLPPWNPSNPTSAANLEEATG